MSCCKNRRHLAQGDRLFTAEPKGFTLIEVLAATALSALLMLAVLQVSASIRRTGTAFQEQNADLAWQDRLADAVCDDLRNAVEIHAYGMHDSTTAGVTTEDSTPQTVLDLTTCRSFDTITLQRQQRPSRVTYVWWPQPPGLLWRIERDLTQPVPTPRLQLLAMGIQRLSISPQGHAVPATAYASGTDTPPSHLGLVAVSAWIMDVQASAPPSQRDLNPRSKAPGSMTSTPSDSQRSFSRLLWLR